MKEEGMENSVSPHLHCLKLMAISEWGHSSKPEGLLPGWPCRLRATGSQDKPPNSGFPTKRGFRMMKLLFQQAALPLVEKPREHKRRMKGTLNDRPCTLLRGQSHFPTIAWPVGLQQKKCKEANGLKSKSRRNLRKWQEQLCYSPHYQERCMWLLPGGTPKLARVWPRQVASNFPQAKVAARGLQLLRDPVQSVVVRNSLGGDTRMQSVFARKATLITTRCPGPQTPSGVPSSYSPYNTRQQRGGGVLSRNKAHSKSRTGLPAGLTTRCPGCILPLQQMCHRW